MALFVISVTGAALFWGSGTALRSFERGFRGARAAVQALMIDDRLRAEAGRVRIPYWDRASHLSQSRDLATVPYYEGIKKAQLSIEGEASALLIESPAGKSRFAGAVLVSVAALERDGALAGLDLSYTVGGRAYRCLAAFGSAALAPKAGGGLEE